MSIHDGHRKRFKGEFLARPDSFPDHKLLELLLFYANPRGDTNPVAHELMDRFVSLDGVMDASPEELMKVNGVGEHAVVLLKAVKETGGRYLAARSRATDLVHSTEDIFHLLRPYFYGATVEKVILVCLDGKGKNLGVRVISEGNVNAAEVTTRGVVEAALSLNASHVILAHNHPSGLAIPSGEDKATTRYLMKVLQTVGVNLVDHVVFSDDDMVSMRESGILA
ncbi:MAG: DNA repair protein RadC [Oscillospiraceae bacterium]|nr:DNA repair protein RadC [Oscillospiraceae bacterium]